MAFRTAITPAEAFADLKAVMLGAKLHYQGERAAFTQPTTSAERVLNLVRHFSAVIARVNAAAAVPGIIGYARSLYQDIDPNYDVVAETVATRNAMTATRDNIMSMFPKQAGTNFLLYQTFNADGSLAVRTFTDVQLQPVVALLDDLLTTLN